MRKTLMVLTYLLITATVAISAIAVKEGLVEYIGSQNEIFKSGKADGVISLDTLSGKKGLFAIGPVNGLDGEITIFDSKPYISKVRGNDFTVDKSLNYNAIFLVWSEQSKWRDIAVPNTVKGYTDLQKFVKVQATALGMDASKPFPFLLSGTPVEIKWHINVDRTDGKTITKELFAKSKEGYIIKNETVDIIGFYSEKHHGVFVTKYAPAITEKSGLTNFIHMHLVSKTTKATGHIDDITLGEKTILSLPRI